MAQFFWIDTRLSAEHMRYLWNVISEENKRKFNVNSRLAGNISKSEEIIDENNWFYENVLKKYTEKLFYDDWDNYRRYRIEKEESPPEFEMDRFWVNYQKKHEFNPLHHHHSGGEGYSFVIFMKIPTHWKEQHALPISANSNSPCASNFEFVWSEKETCKNKLFPLSPKDEGRMLFFRARQSHQVFPFYGTEEERITISGNIVIEQDQEQELQRMEHIFEQMKQQIKTVKEQIKHEKSTKSENQKTPLSSILN